MQKMKAMAKGVSEIDNNAFDIRTESEPRRNNEKKQKTKKEKGLLILPIKAKNKSPTDNP